MKTCTLCCILDFANRNCKIFKASDRISRRPKTKTGKMSTFKVGQVVGGRGATCKKNEEMKAKERLEGGEAELHAVKDFQLFLNP